MKKLLLQRYLTAFGQTKNADTNKNEKQRSVKRTAYF